MYYGSVSCFRRNIAEGLPDGEVAANFLSATLARPQVKCLLSNEHFSVDGTLIEVWCSIKSFHPKNEAGADELLGDDLGGRNRGVDFRGTRRSNDTHAAIPDPDARLYRKSPGTSAKLCYMGHVRTENRTGLAADAEITWVAGFATAELFSSLLSVGLLTAFGTPELPP